MTTVKILYEDADLIAVEKAAGLLVHPASGEHTEFAEDLESQVAEQLGARPILFHRLDRLSSGVVLMGKNKRYSAEMRAIFDEHRIRKKYQVVVEGEWPGNLTRLEGVDEEGKPMLSTCRILARAAEWTVLEFLLKTGRRHQIRLQCREAGHPVWGDTRFGARADKPNWIALHCEELRFKHPGSQKDLTIRCPIPEHWQNDWKK